MQTLLLRHRRHSATSRHCITRGHRFNSALALFSLFCAAVLAGCGAKRATPANDVLQESSTASPIDSPVHSSAEGVTEVRKQEPVEVEVVQAFVHDEKLNVKVYVSAKTPMPTSDVAVTLRGLSEGVVVGEATQLVSNVTSEKTLNPGRATALQLSIPGQGLNEYQVQCSWGPEAHAVAKLAGIPTAEESSKQPTVVAAAPRIDAPIPSAAHDSSGTLTAGASNDRAGDVMASGSNMGKIPPDLRLQVLALDSTPASCPKQPCDLNYVFRARLQNETPVPVSGIRLALGVAWVNDGDAPPQVEATGEDLRSDEQLIELKQVVLAPGESKNVRVSLDRPLPVVPGGSFVPQLRLLEYSQPSG